MLSKNEIYEALVTDYTSKGQGVAHVEGCAVFLPNAIAGEKVKLRIEKVGKTWAAGKIVEILERSPHRVNRECPVAKLCGGCDFWHMDYEEESRLKAQRVRDCLNRLGGENLTEVPILSAPACHGYRNKAQYPVSTQKGKAYAGFFKAGTHTVIENDHCLILPEQTDAVKNVVVDYVNREKISVYDELTHTGLLRHIYVRRGVVSGQILVCLACNGEKLPNYQKLVERLKKVEGFTTLVLSVNTKKGNAVLGDKFITLYGSGYIEDTLCGLNFRLSPRSFYQVNHSQAQRLYAAAIELANISKKDLVLDLYCGVGTITLAMAGSAGKVIGVEVVAQAVEDARDNARRNGIENAEFFCGDAGQAALELEKQGIRPDVVVVDPPRKGLNADTIEALHRFSSRRIVYVSCDPATLARDVALLKEKGYRLEKALAADLFPRCSHVETVVLLSKGEVDSKKVRVEFSLEDMDKRKSNAFKREKVNNPDHAHILSGILKCPCCGKSMYGNIAKAHSKDNKTRYYYYCKNTVTPTGHECSFRLNLEQTEINKMVAKIISAMVNKPRFAEAIKEKIGSAVDTVDMEKQVETLRGQLKQAIGTKNRLERQMDTLDINDAHYDRKILDLQRRYDEQYDTMGEIEAEIDELQSQIRSIRQEKISGDNIYQLLLAFDEVYNSATEAEQKEFMKAFIERIDLFPEKQKDGNWIKNIVFNFPVPMDGGEVKELPLEYETTVETVCLLSKKKV